MGVSVKMSVHLTRILFLTWIHIFLILPKFYQSSKFSFTWGMAETTYEHTAYE